MTHQVKISLFLHNIHVINLAYVTIILVLNPLHENTLKNESNNNGQMWLLITNYLPYLETES